MNTEKLLRLADLVETIAPEKFDLKNWKGDGDCGTVGCAVGWATEDAWFQAQGLSGKYLPTCDGRVGWKAVSEFFDTEPSDTYFPSSEASFLFSEDSYVTRPAHPKEVAIRIRLFVEHHDEEVVRELELV